MSEETVQLKPTSRHARPAHRRGLMGALVPRGRFARIVVWSLVTLVALIGLAAIAVYALIATGTVTANIATPYIERAIEEQLGGNYKVRIGSVAVETMDRGATVVVVRDLRVSDTAGELVASAPSAEVELEGNLLTLAPKARRVDFIGAELSARIAAGGTLALSTGKGAKPLTSTPPPLPVPAAASPPPASAAPAAPSAPAGAATPPPFSEGELKGMDPLVLRGLAQWLDDLERGGLDGGALQEVGLKDGTLEIRNESLGRSVTFHHISIRLARPPAGGAVLTFTFQGPNSTATLTATIGRPVNGERSFDLALTGVATQDLVQAFTQDWRRFYMDMPLSASLQARLGQDGELRAAHLTVDLGAGQIGNGEEEQERFILDGMQMGLTLDPQRRIIVINPLKAFKNANIAALEGEIAVPATVGQDWPYVLTQQEVLLAGPEMPDPSLVMDVVKVAGRFTPWNQQLLFESGQLSSAAGGLSFSGLVDFGAPVPMLKLDADGTPMPGSTVRRFWPVSIAPPARAYVLENVSDGTVESAAIAIRMPLDLIGQRDVPLPDDAVDLRMTGSGFTLNPMKGLPPIKDARLAIAITGRSVRVDLPSGTVVTPQNRRLAVSDGVFLMPDYFPREPTAQISVKLNGPADAGVEILGMDALKGPTGSAYDPSTTRGKLSALVQVNIHFRAVADPSDTDYSVEATLTDFGLDNVFAGQRVEGASVTAFATPSGILLRGDGKIAGAPMSFEYEKKKDVADADIRVNATLDDTARGKLGVNLPAVTGPVGVRLVGTTNNKDTRAKIELDLGAARLTDLVPGLTKAPGIPFKARFASVDSGKTVKINDLVMDGDDVSIKGSLEISEQGDVIAANFPVFQLNDGDKASLRAERSGDVLKVRITGEVVDARDIMKSIMNAPPASAQGKPQKPMRNQDVDVTAQIGALTGNHGEVLRQLNLAVSRRGFELRTFTLSAKAGRDGTVAGDIRPMNTGKPALLVTTSDAGAMLRFLDIYPKVEGGEMWVAVDPPRGDASPQNGTVHLRDFVVRGEPGLESLSQAARDSSGRVQAGTAVFQKAQANFTRTPGSVAIREGAIWGPAAGVTFDGTLDFANERVAVRGTYVPAYGLNNLFSKVPVLGLLLGGGPNEGLLGVTFEIVGPWSGPTLRVNPLSALTPGFLRKMFEFRDASDALPTR